jgi:hypothetical protein
LEAISDAVFQKVRGARGFSIFGTGCLAGGRSSVANPFADKGLQRARVSANAREVEFSFQKSPMRTAPIVREAGKQGLRRDRRVQNYANIGTRCANSKT